MKIRPIRSLLVMFVAVTLAAALQELLPPIPPVGVKTPWLLGVCVYYVVRREPVWAVVAAIWCGVMQDGLGGVPYGVSLPAFCLIAGVGTGVVKKQMPDNLVTCVIVAAAGGVCIEFLQYVALWGSGGYAPLPLPFLLGRWMVFVVVCIPVAGVAGGVLRLMDVATGNVELENENETFGWNAC